MRIRTQLLMLPLALAFSGPAKLCGQGVTAAVSTHAEDNPVSVRWNRLVPQFFKEAAASRRAARTAAAGDTVLLRRIAQTPPPMLFRIYPTLSVAQYAAVNAASDRRDVSLEATVASASAAALMELFADSTVRASIGRELSRDLDGVRTGSGAAGQVMAGRSLGEDVARRVLAWAPAANFAASPSLTIPTGPGMWYSARGMAPSGAALATSRTWVLDSTSQFRPAPPPAFGSPAFEAALEEVRHVARVRTPEQVRIAQKWNSADPWAIWNETASVALRRAGASEEEAARVLAVLNTAASDAAIACFEAKYHFWTIRPSQVDTTLVLPDSVGLPNFPSYPSGHACSAGAFDAVLGHYFPQEKANFTRIADEQAMSRLYGGIHYRFDNDVGLELGRAVGRFISERERAGALNAWRKGSVSQKR